MELPAFTLSLVFASLFFSQGHGSLCTFQSGLCQWTQSSSDNYDWDRHRGPTPSSNTGPMYDKTYGDSSGYYIYLETSGRRQGYTAVLLSPVFPHKNNQQRVCVHFWYNMYGSAMGYLRVYRVPVNRHINQGSLLRSWGGQQTDYTTWLEAEVCTTYASSDFRIAFQAVRGNDYQSDIAIDDVEIFVLPTTITLSDLNGVLPSADAFSYLIQGVDSNFTCQLPDIDPASSFQWTLGGRVLTSTNATNVPSPRAGLITSISVVTISPMWSNNGESLRCQASNKHNDPGLSIDVTLDVRVPPQESSLSLLDPDGFRLTELVDINEGTLYTFTCVVRGTRPAATIKWFLGGVLQDTVSPTEGQVDELVNTTGNWSLTPAKENHGQEVRCTASTPESEQPFPSVVVTLNVRVLPKRVVLFDSLGGLSSNATTYLVAGVDYWFTCMVRDINPRALFTWTLGDQELPSSNVSDITGTNGLLTSTSLVTMSPLWANHEEWLRCRATNREDHAGSDIAVTLDVKVLPTVISIYKNTTNATYTSEKSLLIEGVESTFTCEVPNVRPAASITWTLGSLTIESTGNKDLLGMNGLTTSTSYVKLLPSWGYHGEVLKCSASNVDGFREVNASVTLDVNVPPQKSCISLLDSEGFKLRDSVDVDEGITYAFTCVVQGTRPAATIEWFLDGVLQDTVSPTDGQVDELVNTTGNWSLTPAKENHGQEVRCTASTPESEEPFPGRTVSLNVLVLPKRVFLFDASGTLSSANTAYLIAGVDHWFACIVQDINPGAWFIWTLGDQELNSNKVHEVVDTNGLINSTGVLTILPTVVKHREVLRCRAINREGHMGSSASVVLDVKARQKSENTLSADVQSIKSGLIVGIVIVGVATVVSIVIIARCIYIRNSAANLTQGRKDATPEVSVEDEEEKDIPTEGSGKAEIPMQVMTSDEGIEPSGWIE